MGREQSWSARSRCVIQGNITITRFPSNQYTIAHTMSTMGDGWRREEEESWERRTRGAEPTPHPFPWRGNTPA